MKTNTIRQLALAAKLHAHATVEDMEREFGRILEGKPPETDEQYCAVASKIYKITPDCQPVFPCWLRNDGSLTVSGKPAWIRFYESAHPTTLEHCTHWHPHQPEAPTERPDEVPARGRTGGLLAEMTEYYNQQEDAVASQAASDCTEPDRAKCPRMCQDFCNEKETRATTDWAREAAEEIVYPFNCDLENACYQDCLEAWAEERKRVVAVIARHHDAHAKLEREETVSLLDLAKTTAIQDYSECRSGLRTLRAIEAVLTKLQPAKKI